MSVFRASFQIAANCRRIALPVNNILLRSAIFLRARKPRRFLSLPAAVGILKAATSCSDQGDASTSLSHIVNQADNLYEGNKYEELYDLLYPYRESDQLELLWRFARSAYALAKHSKTDSARKVPLLSEGLEAAKRAVELDPNSALAYKWASILLDTFSETQGFKERCRQIVPIKELMIKSAKIDSTDPTVMYMLGVWFYEIADLAWYKRKILLAASGVSPNATYEEALDCFEQAEKASPEFYSLNLLMLGKTYHKLGNDEKAIFYLQKAADYPDLSEDDHRARKEATALLGKLNPKK